MNQSEKLDQLYTALAEFQNEIPPIIFPRAFNDTPYIKFEDIKEIIKPYLYKYNLGVRFFLEEENTLVSEIFHASGQYKQQRTKIDFNEEKEFRNDKHEDDEFKGEKTRLAKIMIKDILGLTIITEINLKEIKEAVIKQPKILKQTVSKTEANFLESLSIGKEETKEQLLKIFKIDSFEQLPKAYFDKAGEKLSK